MTKQRLEMVNYLNEKLEKYKCLNIIKPAPDSFCVYYQYKLTVEEQELGISGTDLIKVLNAEGLYFFSGYQPLYFQPVYQQRKMFKYGYPWAAPENRKINVSYKEGCCPVAESLQSRTLTNEHIRPPNNLSDMEDIVMVFEKVLGKND